MTYALGIDVGTTFTAAAIWRDGRAETVALGDRANTVPSVLFLRPDGEWLIGEAAERRALAEPERVAREFKRRAGDPVPVLLAGTPVTPQELMAQLIGWVVRRVTEREGEAPNRVALTCPADWGEYRRSLMTSAAELAGLAEVGLVAEPVAAAVWYASRERVLPGALVGVYDLGGGTFDAAVLRKTIDGFELVGQPVGDDTVGGIDFDAAVLDHLDEALGPDWAGLDMADPASRSAIEQIRANAVAAKEALSSDLEVGVPVILPGMTRQVRLTRAEFEERIRGALESTIETLNQAVASARVTPAELNAVLLVGGSSRIPLVSELVASALGAPVAVDAHPKYAVCLGAAIHAARDLDQATPSVQRPAPPGETPWWARPVRRATPEPARPETPPKPERKGTPSPDRAPEPARAAAPAEAKPATEPATAKPDQPAAATNGPAPASTSPSPTAKAKPGPDDKTGAAAAATSAPTTAPGPPVVPVAPGRGVAPGERKVTDPGPTPTRPRTAASGSAFAAAPTPVPTAPAGTGEPAPSPGSPPAKEGRPAARETAPSNPAAAVARAAPTTEPKARPEAGQEATREAARDPKQGQKPGPAQGDERGGEREGAAESPAPSRASTAAPTDTTTRSPSAPPPVAPSRTTPTTTKPATTKPGPAAPATGAPRGTTPGPPAVRPDAARPVRPAASTGAPVTPAAPGGRPATTPAAPPSVPAARTESARTVASPSPSPAPASAPAPKPFRSPAPAAPPAAPARGTQGTVGQAAAATSAVSLASPSPVRTANGDATVVPPGALPRARPGTAPGWPVWKVAAAAGVAVTIIVVAAVIAFGGDRQPDPNNGGVAVNTTLGTGNGVNGNGENVEPTTTLPLPPGVRSALMQEGFSDRFNRWFHGERDEGTIRYEDDAYRFHAVMEKRVMFGRPQSFEVDEQNVRLEVSAERLDGPDDAAYGLACRHDPASFSMYTLEVSDDGLFVIRKTVERQILEPALAFASKPVAVEPGGVNRLEATCMGGSDGRPVTLTLRVNGELVLRATDEDDPLPPGGTVGLITTTYDKVPFDVSFDDFAVYEL